MANAGASLATSASPERLWRIWSDPPTWSSWNPDVRSATLNGPFAVGTTGTLVTKQARHKITITALERGRSFTLEAKPMPVMVLRFTCRIDPSDAGATIGQSVEVAGLLAALFGKPMAEQIALTFPPILEALKKTAESAAATG